MVVSGNNRVEFFILSVSLKLFCTECAWPWDLQGFPKLINWVKFSSRKYDSHSIKSKLKKYSESSEFRKINILVRKPVSTKDTTPWWHQLFGTKVFNRDIVLDPPNSVSTKDNTPWWHQLFGTKVFNWYIVLDPLNPVSTKDNTPWWHQLFGTKVFNCDIVLVPPNPVSTKDNTPWWHLLYPS